jgi:hypothetical protein
MLEPCLKRAGWRLKGDAWHSKAGRSYRVIEEAAPGTWDRSMAAFLAKAVLRAQAAASKGVESVAVLRVRRATPLTDSRLAGFMDEVAPGRAWILLDEEGRVFPHVASAPELAEAAAGHSVQPAAPALTPSRQASLFTDLSQWMLKVLLAPRLDEKLLAAPRGVPIRNASGLAAAAKVSLPAAVRFLHALEADGQLDSRMGELRIARPLELLPRWRDRTAQPPRRDFPAAAVRGPFALEQLARAATRPGEAPRVVLGLHGACGALGLGHVSGAVPVMYAPTLDAGLLERLGLVAVRGDQRADVVLRLPRYPQSVLRGAVRTPAGLVTDVVQCWLDTSHHRVRGQEQADFLWRRVLKPAFNP